MPHWLHFDRTSFTYTTDGALDRLIGERSTGGAQDCGESSLRTRCSAREPTSVAGGPPTRVRAIDTRSLA